MLSRHRVGSEGIDPAELQRVAAEIPDTDTSKPLEMVFREEEGSEPKKFPAAENLPHRRRISPENAAMIVGIAEGFDKEDLKPPEFTSETAEITPDIAMQYSIRLIEYRIGTELKRVKNSKNANDLKTITDKVETLGRQKGEIGGGNIEAAIKFLKG